MILNYDPLERFDDPINTHHLALDDLHARIWTMLPAIIEAVEWNNGAPYVKAKPAVMGRFINSDHAIKWEDLPLLQHCPLWFPRGGGYSLTFPIQQGDECMIIFSCRSLDEWYSQGKAAPAYDTRMTDLSDGVAIVGLTSQKRPLQNISTNSTQLRSDDGKNVIDVNNGNITITASNEISFNVGGTNVTINNNGISCNKGITAQNNITTQGSITASGNVTGGGISLNSHTHGGVQPGGGNTGEPE